jgi:hypothetical protein
MADLKAIVKSVTKDEDYATLVTSYVSEKNFDAKQAKKIFEAYDPKFVEKNKAFLQMVQTIAK